MHHDGDMTQTQVPHHWPFVQGIHLLLVRLQYQLIEDGTNDRRFADDTFKRIFFNKNLIISIKFSPKFVPKVRITNIPAFGSDNGLAPTRRQAIM